VLGMPAGTYTVSAGEQSTTFTLDMDNAPPEATESLPVITLERTPCFGTCPVYALTVYGDGTAVFVGQDFVEQTGEHRAIIGVEGVNYLVDQFLDAGYLAWEDAYTNREMTDMPSAITSLTVDGRTKRIDHYHGDSSAPPALSDLEDLVDATVDTQQWIGEPQMGLANPATEHCLEQGGRSETRTGPEGNQYGVCIFEDGSECDEWAYFRGECEPSTEVSWDTAVDLISGGYVEMVAQLHDLTVELHLKDGRSLSTLEPAIDVVFAVVEACGDGCSDIVLATE
jgi:putative hemolysin